MNLTASQMDLFSLAATHMIEREAAGDAGELSSHELAAAINVVQMSDWDAQRVSADSAARRMQLLRKRGLVASERRRHKGRIESFWSLTALGRDLFGAP